MSDHSSVVSWHPGPCVGPPVDVHSPDPGALPGHPQWKCAEPKMLLQKAMNRIMYAKCTSKAAKRQPFQVSMTGLGCAPRLTPGSAAGGAAGVLREAIDIAAGAGLHYHREALASYASQFADQLCEVDVRSLEDLAVVLPEIQGGPPRNCWHSMLVEEA